MAGLASHKSASGLGLVAFGASQSTTRFVPPRNPGNAIEIICFSINIFSVVFKVCTTVVSLGFILLRISILSCRFCRCL